MAAGPRRFPRIRILIALVFVGASSLLRYKGETYVEAVAAAKAAAAVQFDLDEVRRNKLSCRSWCELGAPASNGTGIRCGTLDRCFEVARVSPLSLSSLLVYR